MTFDVGPGITGLLGPNGAGKTTLLHMMAGFLAPERRHGPARRDADVAAPRALPVASASSPSARRCTASSPAASSSTAAARLHEARRPGGGGGARHRPSSTLHDAAGPRDRRLLEGHAPAGQGGRGARPRPAGPHPRRAVQRHGPAPAAAHDGPPARRWPPRAARSCSAATSSRRSSGSVRPGARGGRRAAGRFRRLPAHPPPHDRSAAQLHAPLERRPATRARAARARRRSSAVDLHDGILTVSTRDYGALTRSVGPAGPAGRGLAPRAAAGRRVARVGLQLPRAPMTSALVSITLRALLNRRRTLLLALLGVLLVAIAGLFRLSDPTPDTRSRSRAACCSATSPSACSCRSSR